MWWNGGDSFTVRTSEQILASLVFERTIVAGVVRAIIGSSGGIVTAPPQMLLLMMIMVDLSRCRLVPSVLLALEPRRRFVDAIVRANLEVVHASRHDHAQISRRKLTDRLCDALLGQVSPRDSFLEKQGVQKFVFYFE